MIWGSKCFWKMKDTKLHFAWSLMGLGCLGVGLLLTTWHQLARECTQIPVQRSDVDKDRHLSAVAEIARTTSFTQEELEGFDKILARASFHVNHEKTVILVTLNQAWATNGSMMDYFLESFHIGIGISSLLDHLVVIAMDDFSYQRCLAIHTHCFQMTTKGVDYSAEKGFRSKDYVKMTREKILLMGTVLRMGYNLVFTDADVMWLRDPFQQFPSDTDIDLILSCDYNHENATDLKNAPNTGFLYARSRPRTVELYRLWYASHDIYPGRHDQDVLKALIKESEAFRSIGLKIWFLRTGLFGGFCAPGWDMDKVYTIHPTCCVGLQKKLSDIKLLLSDWKRYRAVAPEKVKWSVPKDCKFH